jgi:hypothetical protein
VTAPRSSAGPAADSRPGAPSSHPGAPSSHPGAPSSHPGAPSSRQRRLAWSGRAGRSSSILARRSACITHCTRRASLTWWRWGPAGGARRWRDRSAAHHATPRRDGRPRGGHRSRRDRTVGHHPQPALPAGQRRPAHSRLGTMVPGHHPVPAADRVRDGAAVPGGPPRVLGWVVG